MKKRKDERKNDFFRQKPAAKNPQKTNVTQPSSSFWRQPLVPICIFIALVTYTIRTSFRGDSPPEFSRTCICCVCSCDCTNCFLILPIQHHGCNDKSSEVNLESAVGFVEQKAMNFNRNGEGTPGRAPPLTCRNSGSGLQET